MEFIENVYSMIKEEIEESNLEYIKNTIIDLLHFGLILNDKRIVFLCSELKNFLSGHILVIEDYLEDEEEDTLKEIKLNVYSFVNKIFEFIKKEDLNEEEEMRLFKLIKETRANTEIKLHNYQRRGNSKLKIKFPQDLFE